MEGREWVEGADMRGRGGGKGECWVRDQLLRNTCNRGACGLTPSL